MKNYTLTIISIIAISMATSQNAEAFPGFAARQAYCAALINKVLQLRDIWMECETTPRPQNWDWDWDGPVNPCKGPRDALDNAMNVLVKSGCLAAKPEPELARGIDYDSSPMSGE